MKTIKNSIESKLFNGYVIEPIPLVVLTCLVGVWLLGLCIWGIGDAFYIDDYEIKESICSIVSYEYDGPVCLIETDQDFRFELPYGAVENDLLDCVINSNTPVIIEYKYETLQRRKSYDAVEIRDNKNHILVSQETINKISFHNKWTTLMFLCGVCLLYWVLSIIAYYVLCNAPRYPKLAAILIRKPFRNF